MLGVMGFAEDLEGIEAHQGATNRFSIRLRHSGEDFDAGGGPQEDFSSDDDGDDDFYSRRPGAVNMLIGEQGRNLMALEHILKKIIRKKFGNEMRFTLDINDYRMKRLEDLKQDVKDAARNVRMYRKETALRPMSAFERRIIHMLLAEYPDITTESVGEEPYRRVIIKPYP